MLESFARLTPRALRLRHGVAALATVIAFTSVAAQTATADTAPIESLSTSILPGDWDSAGSWQLTASACGSESCVAVGSYEFHHRVGGPPYSQSHGLIIPINDGVAGTAQSPPLPVGAADNSTQSDYLQSVSCWSAAACVAVGSYTDSVGGYQQGYVVPITDGVVGTPQEVQPPGAGSPNPAGPDPWMSLRAVSCTTSGACVAVGYYSPATGGAQGIAVPINGGVAGTGIEVPAPADSRSSPNVDLLSISCQTSGSCVAVGDYLAGTGSGTFVPLVVPISAGVPGTAAAMTGLPSDADPTQGGELTNVACPASGTCSAIGYYWDSTNQRDLVIPITNGVAGSGLEAPAPADGTGTNQYAINYTGLACQSTGACLAAGSYSTADGTEPVAIPITGGVPAGAERVALPSDAEGSGQYAGLSSVACPAMGACLAVGDYRNLSGNSVPMTASFGDGSLGGGVETAEPTDESTAGNAFAGLGTVACTTFSCAAAGSYSNATTEASFVLSAQTQLAITPTSLAGGQVGTPYSQTLTATGAWSVYGAWSVSSGSLPPGLTLNTQTGSISGTPTTVGTSTFTVQLASTTGMPLQTATKSYSVQIVAAASPTVPAPPTAAAAIPEVRLRSGSATVRKNKFSLKLSCAAAPCHGSLKLVISETVTVKRGNKRVRKHITVAIGNAGFSVVAGQTKSIRVTLNAIGRRALAARHRLNVTVLDTLNRTKGRLGHVRLTAAPVKKKH